MTDFYSEIKASDGVFKAYIDGAWFETTSKRGQKILNPSTNEVAFTVQGELLRARTSRIRFRPFTGPARICPSSIRQYTGVHELVVEAACSLQDQQYKDQDDAEPAEVQLKELCCSLHKGRGGQGLQGCQGGSAILGQDPTLEAR